MTLLQAFKKRSCTTVRQKHVASADTVSLTEISSVETSVIGPPSRAGFKSCTSVELYRNRPLVGWESFGLSICSIGSWQMTIL